MALYYWQSCSTRYARKRWRCSTTANLYGNRCAAHFQCGFFYPIRQSTFHKAKIDEDAVAVADADAQVNGALMGAKRLLSFAIALLCTWPLVFSLFFEGFALSCCRCICCCEWPNRIRTNYAASGNSGKGVWRKWNEKQS